MTRKNKYYIWEIHIKRKIIFVFLFRCWYLVQQGVKIFLFRINKNPNWKFSNSNKIKILSLSMIVVSMDDILISKKGHINSEFTRDLFRPDCKGQVQRSLSIIAILRMHSIKCCFCKTKLFVFLQFRNLKKV